MRCFGGSTPGKNVATVAAGDTLGFVVSTGIMHFGPCQFYMARVPDGQKVESWGGEGEVWFKVGSLSAKDGGGQPLKGDEATWPAYRECLLRFFSLWKAVVPLSGVIIKPLLS